MLANSARPSGLSVKFAKPAWQESGARKEQTSAIVHLRASPSLSTVTLRPTGSANFALKRRLIELRKRSGRNRLIRRLRKRLIESNCCDTCQDGDLKSEAMACHFSRAEGLLGIAAKLNSAAGNVSSQRIPKG